MASSTGSPVLARARAGAAGYLRWHHEVRVTEAVSAVAFWTLLSLGPAGLVTINLLGLVLPQQEIAARLAAVAHAAPGTFGDLLAEQFVLVARDSPGSFATDALLVVTSLWTLSTAVAMLMRGLRRAYGLPREGFVPLRVAAAGVGVCVIAGLGLVAFTVDVQGAVRSGLAVLVSGAVVAAVVLVIYRVSVRDAATAGELWPGAVAAAVGLVAIHRLWEGAASTSPNLLATYGPVAGIVVSMLGVWLAAWCLLLGQYVNVARRDRAR